MPTLDTLLKLASKKVDDKQKEIADLAKVMRDMEARYAELNKSVEIGHDVATKTSDDALLYAQAGNFAIMAESEKKDIVESQAKAKEIMAEKQSDMRILFSEQKRYEMLIDRRKLEEKKAKDKKEQMMLDEVAAQQYDGKKDC